MNHRNSPFHEDPAFLSSSSALPERPQQARQCIFGAAHLARPEDLSSFLTPSGKPHDTCFQAVSAILETPTGRGALEVLWRRQLVLSEEQRNCHLLVVGQPGGGKTTSVILPLIAADVADPERSVVIFDAKGNLYPVVRELVDRHRKGKGLHVLNLTDAKRSVGWNPIRADATDQEIFGIAHQVCSSAEVSPSAEDSPFWIGCSTKLLRDILYGLREDPREHACLGRAFELVHLDTAEFAKWVAGHDSTGRLGRFVEFVRSGSHNAATILADIQMRLRVWLDPEVCAVTGTAELDMDDIVDKPTVLLVEMDETQVEKLRPLWSLLSHQLFHRLLMRSVEFPSGRLPRPVSLLMDEFASSIGRIPEMQVRLNTFRERRVSITAAVQSLTQLQAVYGLDSAALLGAFASKIFLPRLDWSDARYASEMSGVTTVECESEVREVDPNTLVGQVTSVHVSPVGRPLLLPDEIAMPPSHFALGSPSTLFLAGTRPFQAWLPPAWELESLAGPLERRAAGSDPRDLRKKPLRWPLPKKRVKRAEAEVIEPRRPTSSAAAKRPAAPSSEMQDILDALTGGPEEESPF